MRPASRAVGARALACPDGLPPEARGRRARRLPTVLTRAFTGRLARALSNRFSAAAAGAPILPYPQQHALTAELRQAAARAGNADLLSLWAGQGVALARSRPARELVLELVAETRAAIAQLGRDSP